MINNKKSNKTINIESYKQLKFMESFALSRCREYLRRQNQIYAHNYINVNDSFLAFIYIQIKSDGIWFEFDWNSIRIWLEYDIYLL